MPELSDEVEQRLTINAKSMVYFTGYNLGKDILRKTRRKLDLWITIQLMGKIAAFSRKEQNFCTDVGTWKIVIKFQNGNTYCNQGFIIQNQNDYLSNDIRASINIKNLILFDDKEHY